MIEKNSKKKNVIYVIFDKITTFNAVISGVLLFTIALMISLAVILRYGFGMSVGWSTEIAEYFIYISVVLAAPWVLKIDRHVRVDVIVNMLGPRANWVLAIFNSILGIMMSAVLLYYSIISTYENYVKGTMSIRIMPIPKWVPLMFMPIMALLFVFWFIVILIGHIQNRDKIINQEELSCPLDPTDIPIDSI